MRQIISYDDITTTPQQQQQQPSPSKHEGNLAPAQPPAKRRKTTPNQRLGGPKPQQHWDDPGGQGLSMNYDDSPTITSTVTPGNGMDVEAVGVTDEHYGEEEESRELTHEEIWDDSALIEAWNSAAAEYEAYHGPGKSWKNDPVKKSPLWYNVPPATTSKSSSKQKAGDSPATTVPNANGTVHPEVGVQFGVDSTPLNFDTFVPSHDPSLATATAAVAAGPLLSTTTEPGVSVAGTDSATAMVNQDEAFSRAMTAMYWSGYWTAVYHCRRNESAQQVGGQVNGDTQQEEAVIEEDEDEDDEMLPAQR